MSYPALTELLPHRPPMLWLDEVITHEGDTVHCRLTIREEHAFVKNGRVEPSVSIEWMAQAVGTLVGLRDRERGEDPRIGFLIAIPEAVFDVDAFSVGDVLNVKATRTWGDEQLASFSCEVAREGRRAARAQLSVYRSREGLTL